MNNSVSSDESNLVSWKEIQGNKYSKALHPAMLSVNGYKKTLKASLIGEPRGSEQFRTVFYDRDYVVSWLQRKFIKPMENNSLEDLEKLFKDAYSKVKNTKANLLLVDVDEDD